MSKFNRADYCAEISEKMDDLRNTCIDLNTNDSDSKVFCYLIADVFDTLDEGTFVYTDGPNDLGIDFYTRQENDFCIYQCKSIDLAAYPNGKTFDATPVNELAEAIEYLLYGNRSASASIQKLRGSYQLNKDERSLQAVLAIEGRLSAAAQERLQEIANQYKPAGVEVRLIDETTIFEHWHSLENLTKPQNVTVKLQVFDKGLMKMNGWFCAAVSVGTLLEAMDQYGNALFDSNVRSKLRNSRINADIKRCIATAKGRKQFIHLNNGLVITCSNYTYGDGNSTITLKGAQVVNGCQSLSTIRDFYENADERTQSEVLKDLHVLVKVISDTKLARDNLLDEIIVASNNQNPMNPRNLKSNSTEQRKLQESLSREPLRKELRFFYIRKDGEFDSFLDSNRGRQTMRKSDFAIPNSTRRGKNRYRFVDNEDLGKRWLAWIGNSPRVNSGSVKIFSDKTYSDIFEHRPGIEYWSEESRPDFEFSSSLLEERTPTQFQLLVALAFSTYLEARIKPENGAQFKRDWIQQLRNRGKLNDNSSEAEITEALSETPKYLDTVWMCQMKYGLTETAAFILLRRYGDLQSDTCRKILDQPDVLFWLSNGMDRKLLQSEYLKKGVLDNLSSFLEYSVSNFFAERKSSILLENRPKLYLGKRESIVAIKRKALHLDDLMKDFPWENKGPGQTFLETLPNL